MRDADEREPIRASGLCTILAQQVLYCDLVSSFGMTEDE